nr:methionyl-tRNA formyltransferase [Cryptococcus depauperatus CBS 7855]
MTHRSPPLGPYDSLPAHAGPLRQLKLLLLVTSVNSFTQRILSYLDHLGFQHVSVQLALSDDAMLSAAEQWQPDIWITLIIHPGPPGDAGPSSLDWVLLGDTGESAAPPAVLESIPVPVPQRSHWGTICFQATEKLDGGAVWAWEQYALPRIRTVTKGEVYQRYHSAAATAAAIHALVRVYEATAGVDKSRWMEVVPKAEWQTRCVSLGLPFLGGVTHARPLLPSTQRRLDWDKHTAEDVLRILNASDSQPGAMVNALTLDAKASLFVYGARLETGCVPLDAVPNGSAIATRDGAVLIKTRRGTASGVWITHGRVPRGKDRPMDPKIPMVEAVRMSGHGSFLKGVEEWRVDGWEDGWEVKVKSVRGERGIAQLVYWQFYNGAFTTDHCRKLLSALRWAVDPARGPVRLLVLMGGSYFSNGIALNTIEHAASPGQETWENINAIDDIVSFLVSDVVDGEVSLCQRGIATVACVRGNAAAGGVALAAACDVVLAGRGVVLNPSYRAMGLHGSEFHSFSYLHRCGPARAAEMLVAMKPLNSAIAESYGLVDGQVGSASDGDDEPLFVGAVRAILDADVGSSPYGCAPWARPENAAATDGWVEAMCQEKEQYYTTRRTFPPLQHFRDEELSQMLLDAFHPVRSKRYHTRRYRFIRKIKPEATPARYALHWDGQDEEDGPAFDDAPGWKRGEEWSWVDLPVPASLATSECLRIPLWEEGSGSDEPLPKTPVDCAVTRRSMRSKRRSEACCKSKVSGSQETEWPCLVTGEEWNGLVTVSKAS